MLAPFAVLDAPATTPDASALWSIVVLGVASTAAAFILMFILIAEVGASRASVITYVNPVVAVALGVTLLDESLGAASVAGLLLILAGSWLATRSARSRWKARISRGTRALAGALSAARAAFAPHAPCTPPPGCADADAR